MEPRYQYREGISPQRKRIGIQFFIVMLILGVLVFIYAMKFRIYSTSITHNNLKYNLRVMKLNQATGYVLNLSIQNQDLIPINLNVTNIRFVARIGNNIIWEKTIIENKKITFAPDEMEIYSAIYEDIKPKNMVFTCFINSKKLEIY